MDLADMQQSIRSQLNDLRALDRIVQSTEFQQCLLLDPANNRLMKAIRDGDLEGVREWMSKVIEEELCDKSIRQLRMLASQLGILNYGGLHKDELLIQIVQVKREPRQAQATVGGMSPSANGLKTVS